MVRLSPFRNGQDKERGVDLGRLVKKIPIGIALLASLTAIGTSFYTCDVKEKVVRTRFGAYVDTKGPGGPYFKAPFGIDQIKPVDVTTNFRVEVGYYTQVEHGKTTYPVIDDEALRLTGDENIVKLTFSMTYVKSDPVANTFNNKDNESEKNTVRDAGLAVMGEILGDCSIDEILTVKKIEIQGKAKELSQEVIDAYKMGLTITNTRLLRFLQILVC